ncbi:MAG: DUF86 domain-containing protein [Anaerolineales bacterium]|nr:DUF86 domain-containing protein [Anaerolineales bacterium]
MVQFLGSIIRYFGVDYETVWDVATNKIPDLHQMVTAMIETEG